VRQGGSFSVGWQTDWMPHPTVVPLQGDITKLAVDAIVNAANNALSVGGGVDAAIHEAAGEQELSAACAQLGGCETGDAKATGGFRLPARWIIHAVGPVWQGGQYGEAELLASCYRRAIEVAEDLDAQVVAFPAISTGIFGFPRGLAAQIAVSTLRELDTTVQRVVLVAFDKETLKLYEHLLGDSAAR
jgi:O-acetyl-ADP-ribose deacetylase